jgi:Trk K+ transport system NAD-binding subunit
LGGSAVLGDATNPRILKAAGADKARIIVSTMRRLTNNEKLLSHTGDVKTVFSVFEPDQAERLRAHGGIPILESHAAADELLRWFERECQ